MANPPFVKNRFDDIDKSLKDTKKYRGLELMNGLRVLLVSNPSTKISSVALDVACGSLMDPGYMQGVARLCEHMLFNGNRKASGFGEFLAVNMGRKSADTFADHTLFRFSIIHTHLLAGLTRFAQLFIEPLFSEDLKQEIESFQKEHERRRKLDQFRLRLVEKSLSSEGHDYRKYDLGSRNSLTGRPRRITKKVAGFFNQWYIANLMTLVIFGKESLDQLEGFLKLTKFHEIVNKNVEKKMWSHPWEAEQLGKRVQIVSVEKSTRMLKLIFPLPGYGPLHEYESKPMKYIDFLMSHGARGGLVWELKQRGLTTDSHFGFGNVIRNFSTYEIRIDLSKKGLRRIDEIVELVFRYVGFLHKSWPLPERIQDELNQIGHNDYNFMRKEIKTSAVPLASTLQDIQFKDVITSNYLMPKFNLELIYSVLELLTPQNMNYFVVSSTFTSGEDFTEEPIYGTKMRVEKDHAKTFQFGLALKSPGSTFCLPEKNDYIPTKFDLKPREKENLNHPILLDRDGVRVWFQQDTKFKNPQMMTWISITSPVIDESARSCLLALFYQECLKDCLAEQSNALAARLVTKVELTSQSFNITISGYDEKQPLFVRHLVKRILEDFSTTPERFKVIAETLRRNLADVANSRVEPHVLCQHYVSILLKENFWNCMETFAEFKGTTLEGLRDFKKRLFSDFNLEIFAHGNVTKQEALDMAKDVRATLQETSTERPQLRERRLETGKSIVIRRHYQNIHEVSCVYVLWQTGVASIKGDAMLHLLVQLIEGPVYFNLYSPNKPDNLVFVGPRFDSGTSGLEIVLQGSMDPESILKRIESFLVPMRAVIEVMTAEFFQKHIDAAVEDVYVKPKTLKECSTSHWEKIIGGRPDFDRDLKQCEEIKKLTKKDVLDFFDSKIAKEATERRMVIVFFHAKKDFAGKEYRPLEPYLEEVECIKAFREHLGFFDRSEAGLEEVSQ